MKGKLPPADVLWKHYNEDKMSIQQIAKKYKATYGPVHRKMKRAGLQFRSLSEAFKLAYEMGRRERTALSGPNHWAWKGGKERRRYRDKVQKEKCANCDSRQNLGVHHKDLDHYNDNPDNMEILCVSCHMSLHKKMWWVAKKAGKELPKSNGPIGWRK